MWHRVWRNEAVVAAEKQRIVQNCRRTAPAVRKQHDMERRSRTAMVAGTHGGTG